MAVLQVPTQASGLFILKQFVSNFILRKKFRKFVQRK